MKFSTAFLTLSLSGLLSLSTHADQLFHDNVGALNSLGVGIDITNGEDYGFDTIRLKENNLRIRFQDTSVSASFPSNDWQLTANDSTNGGANKFSIDDITSGRTPFTVEAGAPSHSLFSSETGDLGIRTDNPGEDIHIVSNDSPGIRFDQNEDGGLAGQVWDLVGNEAGIHFRDGTNGGVVPFQIKPGSLENSIAVGPLGVGLGLANATAKLHVQESADVSAAVIENTNPTSGARNILELRNNGPASLAISNTTGSATASDWDITVDDTGSLVINSGGNPFLTIDTSGNVTAAGTVNGSSDRNRKDALAAVDGAKVLEKLSRVPMQTWRYTGEDVIHIGPMAQDFHEAFSLGASDRVISMADADGIALVSIQALHREAKEKEQEITDLKAANRELEERLSRLEKLLAKP